uniref:Uncharacterized protein n=1 Tax=Physcomitrium patens TaxID=3218 RepID=A0A2K1IWX8_PHYPA|nr:hypothetical protein PHYPA_023591 [Physcomitrium patens]
MLSYDEESRGILPGLSFLSITEFRNEKRLRIIRHFRRSQRKAGSNESSTTNRVSFARRTTDGRKPSRADSERRGSGGQEIFIEKNRLSALNYPSNLLRSGQDCKETDLKRQEVTIGRLVMT